MEIISILSASYSLEKNQGSSVGVTSVRDHAQMIEFRPVQKRYSLEIKIKMC